MPIQKMTDISKFDYRLLKKDIIYTFESMAQYVHLRFNQYIKDVLPAEILAQMESDQKNNLFKISTRPLNADLEEKLYAFIDGEVADLNRQLDDPFNQTQCKALSTHIKQLVMPYKPDLCLVWHSQFTTQILNTSAFPACLMAIGMRMWFRHKQKRVMDASVLNAFRQELYEEVRCLTSVMKNHIHYGVLEVLVSNFMQSLNLMYRSNMPKNDSNVLLYKTPSYLTQDYPIQVWRDFSSSYTQIFINADAEEFGIPTILNYIRSNEDACTQGEFPQMDFRMWLTKQQEKHAQLILSHIKLLNPIKRLKLDDEMFDLTNTPCGTYYSLNALAVSNFFIDLLKVNEVKDGRENVFGNLYIDAYEDTDKNWVAIATNVIMFLTQNFKKMPSEAMAQKTLKPVVLSMMILMTSLTQSKNTHVEIKAIIDEALANIFASKKCEIEEELYNKICKDYGAIKPLKKKVVLATGSHSYLLS